MMVQEKFLSWFRKNFGNAVGVNKFVNKLKTDESCGIPLGQRYKIAKIIKESFRGAVSEYSLSVLANKLSLNRKTNNPTIDNLSEREKKDIARLLRKILQ